MTASSWPLGIGSKGDSHVVAAPEQSLESVASLGGAQPELEVDDPEQVNHVAEGVQHHDQDAAEVRTQSLRQAGIEHDVGQVAQSAGQDAVNGKKADDVKDEADASQQGVDQCKLLKVVVVLKQQCLHFPRQLGSDKAVLKLLVAFELELFDEVIGGRDDATHCKAEDGAGHVEERQHQVPHRVVEAAAEENHGDEEEDAFGEGSHAEDLSQAVDELLELEGHVEKLGYLPILGRRRALTFVDGASRILRPLR